MDSMLHHISFAVADLARSATFYDATLAPLGYVRVFTLAKAIGYGNPGGGDQFAIRPQPGANVPGECFHVAFAAPSHEAVDAFYRAALTHGGKDNGDQDSIPNMERIITLHSFSILTGIALRQ
jgi:catechol 2,3-dioxygenase-like lactoylglutathione lyase family enzyme